MFTLPTHIIAIGASAGGMEEINTFFDNTPFDGVAYVIVQHLSADFKSKMGELLAKHSKLTIHEAEDAMQVMVNQVYLIPNNMYLTIKNNIFSLSDKKNSRPPHLTIDRFFLSLAINSGSKAIAIVLSGLGTDGTRGIKAIKEAGGMCIARDPENTEFASMPSSAIASGAVDFILDPEYMPGTIEEYIQYGNEVLFDNPTEEKYIAMILQYISQQLPFDFTEYKQSTISRRIIRRVSANHFTRLENYLDFLQKTPSEVERLVQEFLISVTSFFRDKEAYSILEKEIIPGILAKLHPGEEVKIWSAGCATGEEAYSLAILFHEQLKNSFSGTVVKIFATDINTVALIHAGKGLYTKNIEKDISPQRLAKYFTKEENGYRVKSEIRNMLIFAPHDLVKNPPYCNMHLIACRNLLIYMNNALQKKIFPMLLFGLKLNGYLFLGSSENPQPIAQHLQVINKKWRLYRNLETRRIIHFDGFALPQMVDINENKMLRVRTNTPEKDNNHVTEGMMAMLAESLDFLAISIDENYMVIKTYGNTAKYLLQKNFNLHLPELLPRPLSIAFNSAIINARKGKQKVILNGLDIEIGGSTLRVRLSVEPLKIKSLEKPLFLVVFCEDRPILKEIRATGGLDEKIYLDQYTLMIEEELNGLKDKLDGTYRQLDDSNDNMQSYVEELLSANEEMQSTNEEMQSVNEELHTINSDYQLKNKELLDLNDDLNNYFRSNLHAQLFVDTNLLLMKFSPAAVTLINLVPSDVGRPLNHISTNMKFETVVEDIKEVILNGSTISREIETMSGLWFQVMTMPYIQQADHKRTGAIITFNDITLLKNIQKELDKRNASLVRINDDLNNFVNTTSHDLLTPLGNIEMSIAVMNQVEGLNPELAKFLTVINNSIKKFRLLITEISEIAQLENDALHTEYVDINEVISNVEWSLGNKIKENNAVIKRHLEVTNISFSKKNMRSILYNLISNAIKFHSALPPQITIRTFQKDGEVLLSVEDNGIGMEEQHIEKIWRMYSRLSQTIEGHGIGMFLTKKIVNAAGGQIAVDSIAGKGSKFIVTLPL
jgi:two-component system CheB/CheR fusion protein